MAASFSISSDSRFQASFDLVSATKTITVTDLRSADYGGFSVTTVKGLIKIINPKGILYKNDGYDDGDFSSPDINSATSTWSKAVTLATDGDDEVYRGYYEVSIKFQVDAQEGTISKNIDFDYQSITPALSASHSLRDSTMTVVDGSDYSVEVDGETYEPINDLADDRTVTIRYPLTSGQDTVTSSQETTIIGPNIWSNTYNLSLETELYYNVGDEWLTNIYPFEIYDSVDVEIAHEVTAVGLCCAYKTCLDALYQRYLTYEDNNPAEASRLRMQIIKLNYNYLLYNVAEACGNEKENYCENIQAILKAENCSCTEEEVSSIEIIPYGSSGGGGSITPGDGTVWHYVVGSGYPSPVLGDVGDFAINDNGDIFKKGGTNIWNKLFNITGEKGDTGATGAAGADGADGTDGDDGTTLLNNYVNATGNGTSAGTSLETLASFSFTESGFSTLYVLRVTAVFKLAQNSNGKKIGLYYNGTALATYDLESTVLSRNDTITIRAEIAKPTSTTQFTNISIFREGVGQVVQKAVSTSEVAATAELKAIGQNSVASAGDIVCHVFRVEQLKGIAV